MYILIKQKNNDSKYDISRIEFKIDPEADLNDLLAEYEKFLLACGFIFDGRLEIVPKELEHANPIE